MATPRTTNYSKLLNEVMGGANEHVRGLLSLARRGLGMLETYFNYRNNIEPTDKAVMNKTTCYYCKFRKETKGTKGLVSWCSIQGKARNERGGWFQLGIKKENLERMTCDKFKKIDTKTP